MSTYEDMLKGLIQCGAIESYEMLDETTAKIKFKTPLKWVGIDFGYPDKQAYQLVDAEGKLVNPFVPLDHDPVLQRVAQEQDWRQQYLAEFKPYDPEACIPCDGTGMRKSEDPNYPYIMTCNFCKGTGRKRIPDERICMCGHAAGHTTNARCSNCRGLIK